MRKLCKPAILAAIGGMVYISMELLWRGYSHWTMFVLGGLLFVLIGAVNEHFPWEMPLALQGVIGAVMVTAAEFAAGVAVNLWLGWGVWNYSDMPLNLLGQICLPYALLWVALAVVGVVLDDWLRYWLFGEVRPRYKIF